MATIIWSDLDGKLERQQDGDIKHMVNSYAILNSIQNILTTQAGSRRMLPQFALPFGGLLFEPIDDTTATIIGNIMLRAIEQWEDRIVVDNINIWPEEDSNMYVVTLTYTEKESNQQNNITFNLGR